MATTPLQKSRLYSCKALHEMLDDPRMNIRGGSYTSLWRLLGGPELTALIMRGKFPIRLVADIHWGAQGKAAAELDCQRRLREAGR